MNSYGTDLWQLILNLNWGTIGEWFSAFATLLVAVAAAVSSRPRLKFYVEDATTSRDTVFPDITGAKVLRITNVRGMPVHIVGYGRITARNRVSEERLNEKKTVYLGESIPLLIDSKTYSDEWTYFFIRDSTGRQHFVALGLRDRLLRAYRKYFGTESDPDRLHRTLL